MGQCRPQVGIGRRPTAAFVDRLFHRAEAFLLLSVVIARDLIARLRARIDEGLKQRVVARAACDVQWPVCAAPFGVAAVACVVPCFHSFEVGQHVRIGPACSALISPMIIVARVAAHIDHAVD